MPRFVAISIIAIPVGRLIDRERSRQVRGSRKDYVESLSAMSSAFDPTAPFGQPVLTLTLTRRGCMRIEGARSEKDITRVSGTLSTGSIPVGRTSQGDDLNGYAVFLDCGTVART